MKLKLPQHAFAEILASLEGVAPVKTFSPVLSHGLLEARENTLRLTVTDLELCVTRSVPGAFVDVPGCYTLPLRKLAEIWRTLPTGDHEIVMESGNMAKISYPNGSFKIFGLAGDEYPPLPVCGSGKHMVMDQVDMLAALNESSVAVSRDESRPALSSILIRSQGHVVEFVGTDGRRLAVRHFDISAPSFSLLIPGKTISYLKKFLSTGSVRLSVDEQFCAFEFPGHKILSRRVEANYPDYARIIPAGFAHKAVFARKTFLECVHRVSMLQESVSSVSLSLTAGHCQISCDAEDGEATDSLSCDYSDKDLTLGFNPEFLMAGLRGSSEEAFEFAFNAANQPAQIATHANFRYILMPMRLQS